MKTKLAFYYKSLKKDWLCKLLNMARYHIPYPKKDTLAYTRITAIAKQTGFSQSWLSMFYAGKGIQSSGKVLDSGYSKRKKKSIAPTRNHKSVKIQKEIIDFAVNPETLL